MKIKNKVISTLVLRLSAVVCGFSVFVFVFLLFQLNKTDNSASALSYNTDQIILSVNNQRVRNGQPPLTINTRLSQAAQNKANHMAENSYFSHIGYGKKWSDFIKETGYEYSEAGENLANGFDTVEEMTLAWMNSPSHKENIINQGVNETGVGISYGQLDGFATIFVVQVFGKQIIKPDPVVEKPSDTAQQPIPEVPVQTPVIEPAKKPNSIADLITLPETIIGQ